MVDLEEALSIVQREIQPLDASLLSLDRAAGLRLARDVIAPHDLWPFARAAMDGYAVRSADLAQAGTGKPVTLRVVGTAYAGPRPHPDVLHDPGARRAPPSPGRPWAWPANGEAVRIMTGARLPDGADAVVPFERVATPGPGVPGERMPHPAAVTFTEPVRPGLNVFLAAEECRAGDVVARAGAEVTPGLAAYLAALGVTTVTVVRAPRVAILACGDELVPPERVHLEEGEVRDSNTLFLSAQFRRWGAEATSLGIAPDDPQALAAQLREAAGRFDLVLLTGGASAGDRDHARRAVCAAGGHIHFSRLAIKPGKSVVFATTARAAVFGLPGTPGAMAVLLYLVVRPAVYRLMGAREPEAPVTRVAARLMRPIATSPGRPHYLWGVVAYGRGQAAVWPCGASGSATIGAAGCANALIEAPAAGGTQAEGRIVPAWLLRPAPTLDVLPVPVVTVVGRHDAGKTTLIERLLPALTARGLDVACVKHDVHGFEMDREGKDTWRLTRAGARRTAITSTCGRAALLWNETSPGFDALVSAAGEGCHLVLAEGFRSAGLPRIEVVAPGARPETPVERRLAVVVRESEPLLPDEDAVRCDEGGVREIADRIVRWYERWHEEWLRRLDLADTSSPGTTQETGCAGVRRRWS